MIIQFRGIRTDNNEFIHGDLNHNGTDAYGKKIAHGISLNSNYYPSEVYTNTIGQFTGKKDINGKDVYVGDKSKDGGVIEWYQDTCQFVIKLPGVEVQELKDCEKWLEVVGTIHDKD